MFSPAAKAGLQPGNTILVINDWKIEGMDQPQVSPFSDILKGSSGQIRSV
jgi:hypothetical protein